ncbi:MAG: DOMON domain-containing protein [Candidatus Bathyarchaeia archaeon]
MARNKTRLASILILLLLAHPVWAEEPPRVPYVEDSAVVVDGSLEAGEYGDIYRDSATGIEVHWEHNGSHLRVGLASPGSGWVSIGFGPRGTGMDGANIVIGYVDDGLVIIDEVGIGWNHFPDSEKGGEDDIVEAAGSIHGGRAILEFVFPLSSGDSLDHSFRANRTYGFFLGYHESARDTSTLHTSRSDSLDLFIEPAPQAPPDQDSPRDQMYLYALAAVAIAILGGIVAWILRRPKVVDFRRSDGWPEP